MHILLIVVYVLATLLLTAVCMVVGAIMNCWIRGGDIEAVFFNYENVPGTRYVNVLVYGLFNALSGNIVLGCTSAIAMLGGQAPGWGDYIRAMRGIGDKSVKWGIGMMTLRGAFWGAVLGLPVLALSHWYNIPHAQMYTVLVFAAGTTQGLVYYGWIWAFRKYGWVQDPLINDWTAAEYSYGALLWGCSTVLIWPKLIILIDFIVQYVRLNT